MGSLGHIAAAPRQAACRESPGANRARAHTLSVVGVADLGLAAGALWKRALSEVSLMPLATAPLPGVALGAAPPLVAAGLAWN